MKDDLSPKLARLSPAKRALFEERLRSRGVAAVSEVARIPRVTRGMPLPASFAQERLWFLDRLSPGDFSYNISTARRVLGDVDDEALVRAFDALVARHEALRTTFDQVNDRIVQQIHDPVPGIARVEDASGWEDAAVQECAQEESVAPFDLRRGPLLRIRLLRRSQRERFLLVTVHHIVSDGWSQDIFNRETLVFYDAFRTGQPAPLRQLEVQYADFAAWQRAFLSDERLAQEVLFWKRHLRGAPMVLELASDRPRPPFQTHRGAGLPLELPKAVIDGLREIAREHHATLFMVLLASFGVLVGRHSGQKDVLLGTPTANRTRSELEPLIGFFVNTLALRVRFDDDPPFAELLERVQRATLEAFDHQDLPFEKLVEALNPTRDMSRGPVIQAGFALQNAPLSKLETGALVLEPLELERRSARYDVNLSVTEREGGASAWLEYSTDLFDRSTALRLLEHWRVLLDGVCRDPRTRCGALPLVSGAERTQLVVAWNATRREEGFEACVHELFEKQVDATPDDVAVLFGDEELSYRELDERADHLAHALRAIGVGPEVLVGVAVDRSADMVVALVATLKAGGGYLPLDPSYPCERVAFMLEDSAARIVVTQRHLADRFAREKVRVLLVDDRPGAASGRPSRLRNVTHTLGLAYTIYTSGSTGRPKGVMVPHRAVANLFAAMDERVGIDAAGVWLAVTSVSFDISVLEILWTLTRGFRVVIHPGLLADDSIADSIRRYKVTHLQCTPSACAMLMAGRERGPFGSLKKLLVGGEALPLALARDLLQTVPGEVLNMYGPTETCIWSSTHLVSAADPAPIGLPVARTQMYVVDDGGELAPVGVAGELVIGGEGVTRGYLARPELTAERFVPDPFGAPGGRVYRTGDLARRRADGVIEFLGRMDDQVKLRGFRIELGEIESLLTAHESVRECVALLREDSPGDKRLVAYVTPKDGAAPPTSDALRDLLTAKLPHAMIPNAFVVLPDLPRTRNGKRDRKALPAPDPSKASAGSVGPSTSLEELLVGIWMGVLHVAHVGVHDDFFELGGHSLLATQVLARIERHAGVELTVRALFEAPTIAGLAERVILAQLAATRPDELEDLFGSVERLSDAEAARKLTDP